MSGTARVVFLGSGAFAEPAFEALVGAPEADVVAVVTAPDRPAGRLGQATPVPIARRAVAHGLTLLQPPRLRAPDAIAAIEVLRPTLGVLADYGQIVPAPLLAIVDRGILNLHPSLLPRHRGAAPIAATILDGDREAGITIIRLDGGLDTGPIVAAEAWPLDGTETAPALEERAAVTGASLLRRILGPWLRGEIAARPQDGADATLTRPLRREDGRLDPGRGAVALERQVRGLQPWPGTFLDTPVGRLAVHHAAITGAGPGDRPGAFVETDLGPAIATADGALVLLEVQPAGGRRMTGAAFARGRGRGLWPRSAERARVR